MPSNAYHGLSHLVYCLEVKCNFLIASDTSSPHFDLHNFLWTTTCMKQVPSDWTHCLLSALSAQLGILSFFRVCQWTAAFVRCQKAPNRMLWVLLFTYNHTQAMQRQQPSMDVLFNSKSSHVGISTSHTNDGTDTVDTAKGAPSAPRESRS